MFKRNEFWHALPEDQLRGLIIEETGQSEDSPVVTMVLNTIKGIRKFANFEKADTDPKPQALIDPPKTSSAPPQYQPAANKGVGLNLGYTINLNLPATSDIAVFNAIFKSLKDNLLEVDNADG